ncbi:glycosyltransferase family 4 protein [Alkalitalea saponilacus]|uniref:Glycosyltransferase involved in cell wall bisynthesis n=1 Tax=Alkalitalea saponilacus TaxID=889453 RepID=A0A1T5GZF3_9BACT|nr:glycosyltransferase family 1 protein [Alkalitalea saponilacus]ASB50971.1 glycosyl transferase [Alkalitalea saponilacus]SKC13748.1 Glycosyltransferase involved in cell wall bisynthesis [Alkalitalea saponilacus]
MQITYFQRKPYDFHYSIEKLFDTIRTYLPEEIRFSVVTCPYHSLGITTRIKNILFAYRNKGEINHITGDIHYLSLSLPVTNTINTFHDFTFLRTSNKLKYAFLKLFWVTIPVKRSSIVTVISETTKRELIQLTGCAEEKIKVIPNIIPSHFVPVPKQFNSHKPIILHIGTTPNKNTERLFEAIKNIHCQLLIVGKLSKEHQDLLQKYDIDYTNYFKISEEQLTSLYQQCDILSFCSLNEGFGMPILEAQATGRPVVTSNISSMPEVAGEGACYVNPFDVNDIRKGILSVINDDTYRETLITNGLKNTKRFQPKEVAAQYVAIYEEISNSIK